MLTVISERKSKLSDVITELEVVLSSTKEKEQSLRLQRAINTLKKHTVTLSVNGTSITLFTDSVDEVKLEGGISPQVAKPTATANFSEPTDENGVKFVDTKVVADYYGVTTETIRNWIKDGKISGKQLSGHRGKWFIPADEFEYLKAQEEADDTGNDMKELLGENYTEDWDVELDED